MFNFLLFILTISLTKELIVMNDDIIINITFILITVLFVHYFQFLKDVFKDMRIMYQNQLKEASLDYQTRLYSTAGLAISSIMSQKRLTSLNNVE